MAQRNPPPTRIPSAFLGDAETRGYFKKLNDSVYQIWTSTVLTGSFTSAEQTITSGGLLTIAHGFSTAPKIIQMSAICKTAEFNWSIGDEISVLIDARSGDAGFASYKDSTNIYIRIGSATNPLEILNKTTGDSETATKANWNLIIEAWN